MAKIDLGQIIINLNVGTVTNGKEASATITKANDSQTDYLLNLVLPRGLDNADLFTEQEFNALKKLLNAMVQDTDDTVLEFNGTFKAKEFDTYV